MASIKALTLLTLSALALKADASASDTSTCDCYSLSIGGDTTTFVNHALYSFTGSSASTQNGAALDPAFTSVLRPQSYTASASASAPLPKVFSPDNIFLSSDSTSSFLRLQTTRTSSGQASAELASADSSILYGAFRVTARVTGSSGAIASIFTYLDDSHEIDWEVRTQDPGNNRVQATNQPGSDAGATSNVTLGAPNVLGSWHQWQLNWLPGVTEMGFDGTVVDTKTVNAPNTPMSFLINMWSDGGEWSGTMAQGQSAFLDLQDVEMWYNSSSDAGAACSSVCGAGAGGDGDGAGAGGDGAGGGGDGDGAGAGVPYGSVDACGPNNGSASCATGMCCSQHGYCGAAQTYCGDGCLPAFGACGT
ncbi:MAG: hypothetical protein LQ340_004180 [Diploschistes diacapsis]|nr:MAG: hypothetical protein LQ340_004180 [Diploschistes diacapsis]